MDCATQAMCIHYDILPSPRLLSGAIVLLRYPATSVIAPRSVPLLPCIVSLRSMGTRLPTPCHIVLGRSLESCGGGVPSTTMRLAMPMIQRLFLRWPSLLLVPQAAMSQEGSHSPSASSSHMCRDSFRPSRALMWLTISKALRWR